MKKIIVITDGEICKSVIDVIEQQNEYAIDGIISINNQLFQNEYLGYPVLGDLSSIGKVFKKIYYAVFALNSVNEFSTKEQVITTLKKMKVFFPVIIAPTAVVSGHCIIGAGTVIMHNAVINAGAKIGYFCFIGPGALIEHDVVLEDNCFISGHAIINGGVVVGRNSFIGVAATTKQFSTIPAGSNINEKGIFKN